LPCIEGLDICLDRADASTPIAALQIAMRQTAKLFINGRSQAVRLPAAYRFDVKQVFIRQDAESGDVILSRRPTTWDDFFAATRRAEDGRPPSVPGAEQHTRNSEERDPFVGWQE
jgi:antitoxin VapB